MLVSQEVDALLDYALRLRDAAAAERDAFPHLRIGVAHGPAVARPGDWYGRPVNLASRITAIARPGSALATHEGPRRRARRIPLVAGRPAVGAGRRRAGGAVPRAPFRR
jgi:class 3 adenylate cyclase